MTFADFVAACFWPLAVLFAVLLNKVRDPVLSRSIGLAAVLCGLSYLILWVTYGRSSMFAIIDWYLFLLVLGFELIWWGLRQWHLFSSIPKTKLKAGAAVIGALLWPFPWGRYWSRISSCGQSCSKVRFTVCVERVGAIPTMSPISLAAR